MDKKQFRLTEVKVDEQTGTFTGLAAVFGNEDLVGDVVERGAFQRTIADNPEVPILWQHDSWAPIGKGRVSETYDGLLIEGKLALGVQQGREAYELLKEEALRGLSIGYDTLDFHLEDEIRHLTELRLWEVSLVTFAANPKAQVLSVKEKAGPENEATLPDKFRRKLRQITSESVLQVMDLEHAVKEGRVLSKRNLGLVDAAIMALTKLAEAARKIEEEEAGKGLEPGEAPAGDPAPLLWTEELARKWMDEVLGEVEGVTVEYSAQDNGISCSVTNEDPGDLSFTKAFHDSSGGSWWESWTNDGTGDPPFPGTPPNIFIPDEKAGWVYPVLPVEVPYIIEFPYTGVPTITEEEAPPTKPEEGKGEADPPVEPEPGPAGEPEGDDPYSGVTLNEEEAEALEEFGKSLEAMSESGGDGKDPPAESSGPTSDDPLLQEVSDFARSLSQQREDE